MKNNLFVKVIFLAAAVVFLTYCIMLMASPDPANAITPIQYKVILLHEEIALDSKVSWWQQLEKLLNEFAKEGWELVQIEGNSTVIFKRLVP